MKAASWQLNRRTIMALLVTTALSIARVAGAQITQVIDGTGDGTHWLGAPSAIAVDTSGNVYVAGGFQSNNAFKITPGGTITQIIDSAGDGTHGLNSASGIAADGSGNVYVTGIYSNNAFKVTPGGTITQIIDSTGDGTHGLSAPSGIAVDGSGNAYLVGRSSWNAFKVTPGGTITQIIDSTGDGTHSLYSPYAIAVDGSGNACVSGSDNAFKITPGGTITQIIDNTGDGTHALGSPYAIAVDKDGNVYVVAGNGPTSNAFKITSEGTITQIIDSTGDGTHELSLPDGVAVDGSGNVCVAGFYSGNAFKITPGRTITQIIDSTGDGTHGLGEPSAIAVDGSGNVYVAGYYTNNAFKIAGPPPPTNTPTTTPANTPTVTLTATVTPTVPTPTTTRTQTPTHTPTRTPSSTPTASATTTPTPSPTSTATRTLTFTPTASRTATPTVTLTAAPTATPTQTSTSTRTPTNAPTPTATYSATSTSTPTSTVTRTSAVTTNTPTNTPAPGMCIGDCGDDGWVGVDEMVTGVNISLGNTLVSNCSAADADGSNSVDAGELGLARDNVLNGCPGGSPPAPWPTGATQVLIGSSTVNPGATVNVPVALASKGASVAAVLSEIIFDPAIADLIGPSACQIDTTVGETKMLSTAVVTCPGPSADPCPAGTEGKKRLRAVVYPMSDLTPILDGSFYTCTFSVQASASFGNSPLDCARTEASDSSGNRIGLTCAGGALDVSATGTPSTPTATPTITPGTPVSAPVIMLGTATGMPGQQVTVGAVLASAGAQVSGTQNDIGFDATNVAVNAKHVCMSADSVICTIDQDCPLGDKCIAKPDCAVNSNINKPDAVFAFLPPGCSGDCTGAQAIIRSLQSLDAIENGSVLYTCTITIAAAASAGAHPLIVTAAAMTDTLGNNIPDVGGVDGAVCVGDCTPIPTPTTPTNTPLATNTATASPTSSPTPTRTATPSHTLTATRTQTPTPTPTSTATSTPTVTGTQVPTTTPTKTPTLTATATPSSTGTSTPTSSPTNTPSATPTLLGACVVGTDTGPSCTESALDACLPGGRSFTGTVTFNCGGTATITITSTKTISADTTIDGGGVITISGGNSVGVFSANTGVNFTVRNLTIANGNNTWGGGGIYNAGTLTVTNSTFSGNNAGAYGGAIYSSGTLTVSNSTFSVNTAAGGAITIETGGIATVTSSIFSGNGSSAILNGTSSGTGGTLTVANSTFSGNTGSYGAIHNFIGTLAVTNSTFSGNTGSGGAIANFDTLAVTNTTFVGNNAGGDGGALLNMGGVVAVTNSTFSGNGASYWGAIFNQSGTLTLTNTIVAKTTVSDNCAGTITDGGHNLDDGATCGFTGTGCTTTTGSSICNTNPQLDPAGLANNGGPTQTIALQAGGPAINAGDESVCATTAGTAPVGNLDQRGFVRPGVGATNCSIGAYEFNSGPAVCGDGIIAGAEQCDDNNAAGGDGCSATCTIEPGYVCGGQPSACTSVCDDGVTAGWWTKKSPMPTARVAPAVGVVNNILYVIGGQIVTPSSNNPTSVNEAYDPASDRWTTKAPMPTARMANTNTAVVNGLVYVIGGNAGGYCTSANEAYNPVTNAWASKAPMPTPRCYPAVIALGGLIYAVGGTDITGGLQYAILQVYDPTTDTWTTKAPMPTGRSEPAAGGIDGVLYVVGGHPPSGPLATNEAYDPVTDTWSTKAPMPAARSRVGVGVVDGILYAVGGNLYAPHPDQWLAINEAYDPATDSWTTEPPMPTARERMGVGVVNGVLYAVGGMDTSVSDVAVNEAFFVCTAGPTRTATPTPPTSTPTQARTWTSTTTPTATSTPTPTRTPPFTPTPILVSGYVYKPAPTGTPGPFGNGLIPAAGVEVKGFICSGYLCVTSRTPAGSDITDSTGFFSFEVPAQQLDGNLLLLEALVDGVPLHALLTPESLGVTASSLLAGSGAAATSSGITIDPITEAAYSLLNARGLDNFSHQGIDDVIGSVGEALQNQDFAGQTSEQAAQTAENVAANDPNVQQVINQAQFTPTPTPTATSAPACTGDCGDDGQVTVDEILTMVNIALGNADVSTCETGDANQDGQITVDEILTAVNNALNGC
jgi:cysteine-rich repeat protein/predicted outer membrane repeat protein